MQVSLKVVTPLHISSWESYPPGYWTAKGADLYLLDLDDLTADHGIDSIAKVMKDISRDIIQPYFKYYKPVPGVIVRGSRPRAMLVPFIRDGNGVRYVPGSSIKGSLRTAILGKTIGSDPQLLSDLQRFVQQYRGKPEFVFSAWFEKHVRDAHSDPFRAIRVSDANISDGEFAFLEVLRVSRSGRTILAGYYEFLERGQISFSIEFDEDLWNSLAGEFNVIGSERDLIRVWTDWTSSVVSWLRETWPQYLREVQHPVVLGRNTGWTTKTLAYILRDLPTCPQTICSRKNRRRSWPLPATLSTVSTGSARVMPGVLQIL